MEIESYFKKPVNEILAVAPTGKSTGYRYINSTDNKLYELQSDGSWVADSAFSLGAICSVIGLLGDNDTIAHYINSASITEVKHPFNVTSYDYDVVKTVFWKDRILIIRKETVDGYGDILCVYPDGDVTQITGIHGQIISEITVDSRDNLWIGYNKGNGVMGNGVSRLYYNDDVRPEVEVFNGTLGFLPSNSVCGVVADGEKVWVFMHDDTMFYISLYDGYQFIDMTAKFETDTGIDVDAMTALQFFNSYVDDSGMLVWSMKDASFAGNMFYYSGGTFYVKAIPTTFTHPVIQNFTKHGDYVLCITASNSTPAAGHDTIWQWSDVTNVIYDVDNGNSKITHNGATPFAIGTSKIYKYDLINLTAPVEQTDWETEILALLTTIGATAAYKGFALTTNDHVLINFDGTYNTIIRIQLLLRWDV